MLQPRSHAGIHVTPAVPASFSFGTTRAAFPVSRKRGIRISGLGTHAALQQVYKWAVVSSVRDPSWFLTHAIRLFIVHNLPTQALCRTPCCNSDQSIRTLAVSSPSPLSTTRGVLPCSLPPWGARWSTTEVMLHVKSDKNWDQYRRVHLPPCTTSDCP